MKKYCSLIFLVMIAGLIFSGCAGPIQVTPDEFRNNSPLNYVNRQLEGKASVRCETTGKTVEAAEKIARQKALENFRVYYPKVTEDMIRTATYYYYEDWGKDIYVYGAYYIMEFPKHKTKKKFRPKR